MQIFFKAIKTVIRCQSLLNSSVCVVNSLIYDFRSPHANINQDELQQ